MTENVIRIVVTPASPGRFDAFLPDGHALLRDVYEPLLDAAKLLADQGVDPDTVLVMRHQGRSFDAMRGRLGKLAKLTIREGRRGPEYHRRADAPTTSAAGPRMTAADLTRGEEPDDDKGALAGRMPVELAQASNGDAIPAQHHRAQSRKAGGISAT